MKWKTKSGEVIDIKDMTYSHLKNAIAMLERDTAEMRREYPQVYTGDSYYAEQAVNCENRQTEDELERRYAAIEKMKKELQSRTKVET